MSISLLAFIFLIAVQTDANGNTSISISDLNLTLQLILLALLLLSIYSLVKIAKYKVRLDRHRKEIDALGDQLPKEKPKEIVPGNFKQNSPGKEKNEGLKRKNVQKVRIENIHSGNNGPSTPPSNDIAPSTTTVENVDELEIISPTLDLSPLRNEEKDAIETNEKRVLYLKAPDDEKAFYAPEATETPDHETVYALEGTELILFPGMKNSTMNTVMASSDIYIKRVCQIINVKEPQHTQFVMVDPGEVVKENEDFVVTKKMKVKYI